MTTPPRPEAELEPGLVPIEEAIEAYTRGPAWASFEEDFKGTLAPGKLADVAVFVTE